MKLRKARKKTLPAKKQTTLFTHENRQHTLEEAVEHLNSFQDYVENLTGILQDLEWRVDEDDPTLIHLRGFSKLPVQKIVVNCVVVK